MSDLKATSPSCVHSYDQTCAGTSLLFIFNTSTCGLRHLSINKRMKFESLPLSSSDVLLLENQNINGNHRGNSVLLVAAFSTNSGKSWEVGAVLFQTMSEVAIIKIIISKTVSNYV